MEKEQKLVKTQEVDKHLIQGRKSQESVIYTRKEDVGGRIVGFYTKNTPENLHQTTQEMI